MKTMEEQGNGIRILWSADPTAVRDNRYPGAAMYQSPPGPPLRSNNSRAQYCRKWDLSGPGVPANLSLTEIP